MTDPIISIAAAARAIGVSRQTIHAQIKAGHIRRHPTGVRLSEVRADRARNVDHGKRPWTGPASKPRLRRGLASESDANAGAKVPVYDDAGRVIAHVSIADLIAEHGSLEALRQAADADGRVRVTLVRMSEVVEDLAALDRG